MHRSSEPPRVLLAAFLLLALVARAEAIILDDPVHFSVKRSWTAGRSGA